MAIDWEDYDRFDWAKSRQRPMPEDERVALAVLAAEILDITPESRARTWGAASAPGRFAATVIRVSPNVAHRYQDRLKSSANQGFGLKLFKSTADAMREARRVLPFHRTMIQDLPGLPNDRVPNSFDAGIQEDSLSESRAFIVQQWMPGNTLEDLLHRDWLSRPIDGTVALSLIEQLFGAIVIPLWSEGLIWWDFRDANYCYDQDQRKLNLIDVDSLSAYAREIILTPQIWKSRDKGRTTALARLRQMTIRLLLAQGLQNKKRSTERIRALWKSEMETALSSLGKDVHRADAEAALARFLSELSRGELLIGGPSVQQLPDDQIP